MELKTTIIDPAEEEDKDIYDQMLADEILARANLEADNNDPAIDAAMLSTKSGFFDIMVPH